MGKDRLNDDLWLDSACNKILLSIVWNANSTPRRNPLDSWQKARRQSRLLCFVSFFILFSLNPCLAYTSSSWVDHLEGILLIAWGSALLRCMFTHTFRRSSEICVLKRIAQNDESERNKFVCAQDAPLCERCLRQNKNKVWDTKKDGTGKAGRVLISFRFVFRMYDSSNGWWKMIVS